MGAAIIVPAHELVHHKKKRMDWIMGNLMMAFTLDSSFAIEHVQGHHKNVGLKSCPDATKRTQGPYSFFIRSSNQKHRNG